MKWWCNMKLITLLPADKYVVVNKTILTEQDRKNLINLYEPIIGFGATSLYLTLWSDLDRLEIMSKDFNHHHLMSLLKCDLDSIKSARDAIEAVGLIKTYFKEGDVNSYVYELYSPLSAAEFFNNPILNIKPIIRNFFLFFFKSFNLISITSSGTLNTVAKNSVSPQ